MKKFKIQINGMHCSACAANVERSLKKIKGIKEVSVSIMTNKGFIDAEDSVKEEEIRKAVEKVGYKVSSFEVV